MATVLLIVIVLITLNLLTRENLTATCPTPCPAGQTCQNGECKPACRACLSDYATCLQSKTMAECRPELCQCMTAAGTAGGCTQDQISQACAAAPPGPSNGALATCTPADGQWSAPGPDGRRSRLLSKCCQPPDFQLATDKPYKTCGDKLDASDPAERCVQQCCMFADGQSDNYDATWYPMARCACSLWCYNQNVDHFKKYGTAVHYISGDLAEAQTSDSGDFIGGDGYDPSGM